MKRGILAYLTPIFALGLAGIVGYYSVFGLSKLFAGAATAVIILGATLESVKLLGTALLHTYWKKFSWYMKLYMVIGVIILMGITSAGVYGLLTSAYQKTAFQLEMEDGKIQTEKNKMLVYENKLTSIESQQESLDKNITDANANILQLSESLGNNVIQYTDANGNLITTQSSSTRKILQEQLNTQTAYRDTMVAKRDRLTNEYQAVNDSISVLEIKILEIKSSSEAASELGPLMYVAELTGQPMDKVINWFMLLIIFVADPFAVILVVATTKIWSRDEDEPKSISKRKQRKALAKMVKNDEELGLYDDPQINTNEESVVTEYEESQPIEKTDLDSVIDGEQDYEYSPSVKQALDYVKTKSQTTGARKQIHPDVEDTHANPSEEEIDELIKMMSDDDSQKIKNRDSRNRPSG